MKMLFGIGAKYFRWFVPSTSVLQSLLLLVIRLYWGWGFFLTGKGKLIDLQRPTEYFQSLGIPFPHAQAILADIPNYTNSQPTIQISEVKL